MDVDVDNTSKFRKKEKSSNKELKELLENFPDVYGVRRSARSRKEPERYTVEVTIANL
jgi:hypothetical protein